MKKTILSAILSICFVSLLGLTGCANAMVNDGNNVKKYTSSVSGAEGGAVPFKTYNDVFDVQIWEGTFKANITDSMSVTIGTVGWFGGVICSSGDGSGPTYDMSEVKKITFEGRSDSDMKVRLFTSDATAKAYSDTYDVALTDEWQTFEWKKTSGSSTDFGIFGFNGDSGGWNNGDTFYIKNIAFYDASGNEVVPIVNE